MTRRAYLDWLRGVAVLIMIEAHTLDSWTRPDDRSRAFFQWAMVLGGFGAPLFLFLAGVALTLAAGARARKGLSDQHVARVAQRRGWQIFSLAFLFRLQAAVLGGGGLASLLKVDILNVMGVSMLAASGLWAIPRGSRSRAIFFSVATGAVAMLTPLVRSTRLLDPLPDVIEAYLRPVPGRTAFTLFPWAGFMTGGAAVGLWLDSARTLDDERRTIAALGFVGLVLAFAGYSTSFLAPIYQHTSFWTSSPTFFFLRLGILIIAVAIAFGWNTVFRGSSPLQEFGIASLFVYWIHVEMVYGVLSAPIHGRLTFEQSLLAMLLFSLFLFGLVKLKNRVYGSVPTATTLHENQAKGQGHVAPTSSGRPG